MNPTVTVVDDISSRAGQPLSIECSFQTLNNLIRPPIVQWMNSAGSVQSDTSTLSFSPLLTSHGGEYTCTVTINIPELNILLSGEGNTRITVQSKAFTIDTCLLICLFTFSAVSIPSVVIEEVGVPLNGSDYILSCIVTVDDSVDTDIIISSQWLVPEDMIADNSMSYMTETVGDLEQRNNVMFSPLLFYHEGMYTCNASVNALEIEFVDASMANTAISVVVYCK